MIDVVWAICGDGPACGLVFEVGCADRTVHVPGVHVYKRIGWGASERGHRIALFHYVKTLVV